MDAYIIYNTYLSEDHHVTIGGIQTYISDLCEVLKDIEVKPNVVQFSNNCFHKKMPNEVDVYGYCTTSKKDPKRFQDLYDYTVKLGNNTDFIIIFATDTLIPPKVYTPCIAIQHGIFWDIPAASPRNPIRVLLSKGKRAYFNIQALKRVKQVVCVDYNFVNWIRTQIDYSVNNFKVIPNFTEIAPLNDKSKETIKIIFARRLFSYRGTHFFTDAIKRLLDEGVNIQVTIAGTGEDEQWMRERLEKYNNVSFTTYASDESLQIHADKHIAVVPTVGSEGTSLSLLEAMSAQCAVVCTNVGGITNIVIDGFNGLITNPGDADGLYYAIKELIENPEKRSLISKNAHETVKQGFSYEKWKERWKKVFTDIMSE